MLGKNPQKNWGASDKATPGYKLQSESYRDSTFASRAKLQIGQLLFSLAAGTIGPGGWRLFEQFLSAHYREGARL